MAGSGGFAFVARTNDLLAAFGRWGAVFVVGEGGGGGGGPSGPPEGSDLHAPPKTPSKIEVYAQEFRNASGSEPQAEERSPGVSNYLIGNDPSRWRIEVPRYERIRYADLWPGIDLIYYFDGGRIRYDFRVKPGGDPRSISLTFPGASPVLDDDGNLVIRSGSGSLVHTRPLIYQEALRQGRRRARRWEDGDTQGFFGRLGG